MLLKRSDKLSNELEDKIRSAIARDLSRKHVPQYIFATSSIPYNVNGKKLEIPLRAVLSEGKKAFSKRKFTNEEVEALEAFLPYFDVEKLIGEGKEKPKSKL